MKFGHCKLQSSRARRLTLTKVVYKRKPIMMDKIMDQLVQGKIANWDFQQVSTPFLDKTIHVPFDCSEPKIKKYIKSRVCDFLQFCCSVLQSFISFFLSCFRWSDVGNLTAVIPNNWFKEIITDISRVLRFEHDEKHLCFFMTFTQRFECSFLFICLKGFC